MGRGGGGGGDEVQGKHLQPGGHACHLVVRTAAHRQAVTQPALHSQLPRHGVTPSSLERGTPIHLVRVAVRLRVGDETPDGVRVRVGTPMPTAASKG